MTPLSLHDGKAKRDNTSEFEHLLERSWQTKDPHSQKIRTPGPNGEDHPVYIYAYGIGRSQIEHAVNVLDPADCLD